MSNKKITEIRHNSLYQRIPNETSILDIVKEKQKLYNLIREYVGPEQDITTDKQSHVPFVTKINKGYSNHKLDIKWETFNGYFSDNEVDQKSINSLLSKIEQCLLD